MNLFGMLEVSGSALTAERQRAEVVTSNMANAETTRTPEGGPYRRQLVVFRARRLPQFPLLLASHPGPATPGVRRGPGDCRSLAASERYQPGHPDADAKGYVAYPAINPVEEMTDLLGAVRAYELNASAVQAAKTMISSRSISCADPLCVSGPEQKPGKEPPPIWLLEDSPKAGTQHDQSGLHLTQPAVESRAGDRPRRSAGVGICRDPARRHGPGRPVAASRPRAR